MMPAAGGPGEAWPPLARPGDFQVSRAYVDQTMALETTFRAEDGTAVLTDAMAVGRNDRGHDERGIFPAGDGSVDGNVFSESLPGNSCRADSLRRAAALQINVAKEPLFQHVP